MVTFVRVVCSECGSGVQKPLGEVNRSMRLRRRIFCSCACANQNINRAKRAKDIVRVCPCCRRPFKTTTHNKAKRHCSASCASLASVTPKRLRAQREAGLLHKDNLLPVEEALWLRERWRYTDVSRALRRRRRVFKFEHRIGHFVYDLVLLDTHTVVEFDEPCHRYSKDEDRRKDESAARYGFSVVRRRVPQKAVIPVSAVQDL